jgi:hypothetical protein
MIEMVCFESKAVIEYMLLCDLRPAAMSNERPARSV